MILKRIILPWQPWALWLIKGVPRWRSQMILSGRSEKDGRTGTVCRITTLKSPPIRSVLVLVQILESMNVNTSNCKSFHSIYKLDPQHNHFSLPSSLKSCFPRIFKVQGTTKVAAVYFSLDALATSIHFESFLKETLRSRIQRIRIWIWSVESSWIWIQWIQNPFSYFSKETQNLDLDSPQEAHSYFFDSMFQCFAKRIRLSEKVLVRLPMPDCNTFVSYFRVFQMSVIPRVFGQQLWNLAVLLI